jgi:hypothetical protein
MILLALLGGFCAHADVYRWVDENGVTVYSQTPPPEGGADKIKPNVSTPSRSAAGTQKQLDAMRKDLDEYLKDKSEAKQERREQEKREKIAAANCVTARANLENLEAAAGRLIRLPDGSYTRLTEEERQQRLDEARKATDDYCK